jgi:hypothetical protein
MYTGVDVGWRRLPINFHCLHYYQLACGKRLAQELQQTFGGVSDAWQ